MKRVVLLVNFILLGSLVALPAQSAHQQLRKGTRSYKNNEFGRAEEHFRKAEELEASSRGSYNLGNAIYRQGRYEEAMRRYESAAGETGEQELAARAYHNLGNARFQQGQLEAAAEAYKNALRRNPADLETKYNLAMVNRMLEAQRQQQQQQQQEDQQAQDQQQPPEQEQPSDDTPRNEEGDPQQQQSQPQPEPAEQELSREEALELLKVMEQEEQKVQEKLRRTDRKRARPEKDW